MYCNGFGASFGSGRTSGRDVHPCEQRRGLALDKRHSHALDQWHAANSENSQVREFFCCRVSEAASPRGW